MSQRKGIFSLGRHRKHCRVCQHSDREAIEADWLAWGSTDRIADQFGLSRDSLYRHAHALGLFEKRAHNLKKALERIIEQSEKVEVTAASVVSAVQAYAKINANGQWVERVEGVNLNELFDRMTTKELETYAKEGSLPDWFATAIGATVSDKGKE